MQTNTVRIYDTTLRDGAQGRGLAFTVRDKQRVTALLDRMGVDYIEAGDPYSNPKDAEFFRTVEKPAHARLVAFGATHHAGISPGEDAGLRALADAGTETVCIFGKAWSLHAEAVLGVTPEENLRLIGESVSWLKEQGREVIFDAEHFFDGWKHDRSYALRCIETAKEAGADCIALCDTNGGVFPQDVEAAVREAVNLLGEEITLSIHAHNDCGMAEANAIAAVQSGIRMVQCTLNGWGERCGNTNLFTVVPNLSLKLGYETLPPETFEHFTQYAAEFCELCNCEVYPYSPYVGPSAFSHKAGMHINAVSKLPESFEHIAPAQVGAERKFLVSEYVGRSATWNRAREIEPWLQKDSEEVARIAEEIKKLEYRGYQFEGAEASFALLVKRACGTYHPHFRLIGFNVTVAEPAADSKAASAVVRIEVGGVEEVGGAAGNGPVNALDCAMRRAIEKFYPQLAEMRLEDYRVRVLGSGDASASVVRVIMDSSDKTEHWSTVGVSADIVGASWSALVDALEYKLMRDGAQYV